MRDKDRHIIVTDGDSHYYVIPLMKLAEWDDWRSTDSEDERSWVVPEYAVAVGGSPSLVVFSEYEIRSPEYY